MTGTLVLDQDGAYDPKQFNDRLLLEMKDSMAEFESGLIRQRGQQARRGGVVGHVPRGWLLAKERLKVFAPPCGCRR
ncbi:MAG: hypothetical protein JNL18_08440 [Planctomycetaceae bacterium]|nr:hypothetical protein [Planctomycetaceae bacterium]